MQDGDIMSARILIVDDEPANVRLLERLLATAGYVHIERTTDSRAVLGLYQRFQPDLVLLDLMMPHLDGVAVLEQLRGEIPATAYVPVLVLTADATLEARRRALTAGAHEFLTKPFEQFEALLRIQNLLRTRRLHLDLERHNRELQVTVQERTERLLQSEKVATMGTLLAGVAHELNNPLAVVYGQAQLLRETAPGPEVMRRAEKIGDAATRCVRIVKNFLSLARQRPPERTRTALNEVIEGAIELLAYELRADSIVVALDLAPDVPVMWADPHQLHQVLVNLIANAHHAMRGQPQARRLTVTTRYDSARTRVRIDVADTGPGIPDDVRAKVFEAFFTTKPPGEGTGLGLSLCRNSVEEHGGTLGVESEPGRGATFVIEVPVGAPPPAADTVATSAATVSPARTRVLIVDDEVDVAAVFAEMLERDGHTVDRVPNGALALDMLGQRPYDVVLTDTKMPVLDGPGFYEELGRRFPAVVKRVIFLTGDVLSREKRDFLERSGAPFLMKPCDLNEVRRLVQQVLAGSQ
ncbi:MAG: response regulator [Candidatus Rokuibacteriota bacterium]